MLGLISRKDSRKLISSHMHAAFWVAFWVATRTKHHLSTMWLRSPAFDIKIYWFILSAFIKPSFVTQGMMV